jgi:hypothetical protein
MNVLSDTDRGWVAGLFEGEGSFYRNLSNYRYRVPRAQMTQKDRSVLERLVSVTGLGTITGPRPNGCHEWTVNRAEDVDRFAVSIFQLLSERRQQQILGVYEACR